MSAATLQNLYLPRKMPPTARDREIYELVMEEHVSQGELAQRFGLSQGRIAQIVQKVADWVHTVLGQSEALTPAAGDQAQEWTDGERLRLAEKIAYERVELVYGQALEAWRESRQDSSEVRTRGKGTDTVEERITKSQTGKAALLNQAMRAALASARLLGVDVTGREKRRSIEQQASATTNNGGERRTKVDNDQSPPADTCVTNQPHAARSSGDRESECGTTGNTTCATTNNCENSRAESASYETHDEMMERLQAILAGSVDDLLKSAA